MIQPHAIGIVGCGVIGSSWAAFYAGKGFPVKMYDVDPSLCDRGHRKAQDFLGFLGTQGILSKNDVTRAVSNITTARSLEEAVHDAGLVQESAAEDYSVKQDVFRLLDANTSPDALLASSSSGLLMTRIQQAVGYPERCFIAHPFNPPHVVPLVELVPGEQTSPDTLARAKAFFESLGKVPVVLHKEAPGHIANRLAAALWREAVDIVLQGIASVEDVDKALCAGPGLRWAIMGQHLIYHLGGGEGGIEHFIDHLGPAFEQWWQSMATWTSLPRDAKRTLMQGVEEEMQGRSLEELARWRDDKLIRLLKVIQD